MSLSNYQRILKVAAATSGVCTRNTLLDAGVSPTTIDRHTNAGSLERVRSGVYVVAELVDARTPYHLGLARLDGAAISHISAGRLHELPVPAGGTAVVEVTVPVESGGRRFDGVTVHRTRLPLAVDIVDMCGALPVTSLARTVFDLASCLKVHRLRHVVQTAIIHRGLATDDFWACYQPLARRGVRGLGPLRRVMCEMLDDEPVPQSVLEQRLARLLRDEGLTGFRRQYRPPWFDGVRGTVDFADPNVRVVLEADGRSWHATTQAMAEDRRRDRAAAAHGWTVLRVVASELSVRPDATIGEIKAVVASRSLNRAA